MWGHIKRSSHKFIYARSENDIADDDNAADSVCFPVSAIRGIIFVNSTSMILRFESPYQYAMGDNDDNDGLILTFSSTGVHRTFVDEFTREIAFGENQFIILCDNVTGERFNNISTVGITANVGAD
tara:strand:+ start:206 stop:583 length:378 start_codon:yes stop_codon:yes gene_type:complete